MSNKTTSAGAVCDLTPPHFGSKHPLAGGVPAVGAGHQSLVGGDKPTASLLQLTSGASASEGLCGEV